MGLTEEEERKRMQEEMDYITKGPGKIEVWAGFVKELKRSWPETHPGVRGLVWMLLIMFVIMLIIEIMWN